MATSLLLLELETKSFVPKGDCSIPGFEGHIVIDSFSWDFSNVTKIEGKNVARALKLGKVKFAKSYDRSSTSLCKLMEQDTSKNGPHFLRATFKFVDPTGNYGSSRNANMDSIMELELTDGFIDEISIKVAEESKVVSVKEDITFSFKTAVVIRYNIKSPTGRRTAMPEFLYVFPT